MNASDFPAPWLDATAAALLQASLAGGLMVMLLLAVRKIARHRIPAAWYYALGLIAMLRFALPAVPDSAMGLDTSFNTRPSPAAGSDTLRASKASLTKAAPAIGLSVSGLQMSGGPNPLPALSYQPAPAGDSPPHPDPNNFSSSAQTAPLPGSPLQFSTMPWAQPPLSVEVREPQKEDPAQAAVPSPAITSATSASQTTFLETTVPVSPAGPSLEATPKQNAVFVPDSPGVEAAKTNTTLSISGILFLVGEMKPWLLVIWLTGTGLILLRALIQHFRFHQTVRRFAKPADARTCRLALGIAVRAKLRRPPAILEMPHLTSPVACGWRRPLILLPNHLAGTLSDQELQHVLAHEAAHLRHADSPANWLVLVLCAIHWPNPAIWLGRRALIADRELVRDAEALLEVDSPHPAPAADYGHTLLKLTLFPAPATASPGLTALFTTEKEIHRRILTITQPNHTPGTMKKLATLLTAGTAILATFTQAPAQNSSGPDNSQPAPPTATTDPAVASVAAVELPATTTALLLSVDSSPTDPASSPARLSPTPATPSPLPGLTVTVETDVAPAEDPAVPAATTASTAAAAPAAPAVPGGSGLPSPPAAPAPPAPLPPSPQPRDPFQATPIPPTPPIRIENPKFTKRLEIHEKIRPGEATELEAAVAKLKSAAAANNAAHSMILQAGGNPEEIQQLREEIRNLRTELDHLKQNPAALPSPAGADTFDSAIEKAQVEYQRALGRGFGPNHPTVTRIANQIDQFKMALDEKRKHESDIEAKATNARAAMVRNLIEAKTQATKLTTRLEAEAPPSPGDSPETRMKRSEAYEQLGTYRAEIEAIETKLQYGLME